MFGHDVHLHGSRIRWLAFGPALCLVAAEDGFGKVNARHRETTPRGKTLSYRRDATVNERKRPVNSLLDSHAVEYRAPARSICVCKPRRALRRREERGHRH